MRHALLLAALAGLVAGGCGGGSPARVKGQLVENGQPRTFPPTQVAIELAPVGPDGKPDNKKAVNAVVNPDGTFAVVASGGEFPPGTYQVCILAPPKFQPDLKRFAPPTSPLRRELKPGDNELVIDVAKPEG